VGNITEDSATVYIWVLDQRGPAEVEVEATAVWQLYRVY